MIMGLGIIVVNYKSREDVTNYVASQLSKIKGDHKIVIVNLVSNLRSEEELVSGLSASVVSLSDDTIDKDQKIFILPHKDNIGYAQGNNLGFQFLTKHFSLEYMLVSNSDLKFLDDDVVERLISKLKQLPAAAIIGPKIVGLDGKDQSPCRRLSMWKDTITCRFLGPLARKYSKPQILFNEEEGFCYRLMGSFLLIKSSALSSVGGFDPDTFLFWEEAILAERMHQIGYKSYYYPDVRILHAHGKVIRSWIKRKDILRAERNSALVYYRKYAEANKLEVIVLYICFNVAIYFWEPVRDVLRLFRSSRCCAKINTI
jgi:GT2 family glycosyltransferase